MSSQKIKFWDKEIDKRVDGKSVIQNINISADI